MRKWIIRVVVSIGVVILGVCAVGFGSDWINGLFALSRHRAIVEETCRAADEAGKVVKGLEKAPGLLKASEVRQLMWQLEAKFSQLRQKRNNCGINGSCFAASRDLERNRVRPAMDRLREQCWQLLLRTARDFNNIAQEKSKVPSWSTSTNLNYGQQFARPDDLGWFLNDCLFVTELDGNDPAAIDDKYFPRYAAILDGGRNPTAGTSPR